jgi:hypothetical protein
MSAPRLRVVLDTNIVLDLFLFQDTRLDALREQVTGGAWQWWATPPMRNELERVLTYPHLVARMAQAAQASSGLVTNPEASSLSAADADREANAARATREELASRQVAAILEAFDRHAQLAQEPIPKVPYVCKDGDDQKFIDFAAWLASQSSMAGAREPRTPSPPCAWLASQSSMAGAREHDAPAQPVWLLSKDKAVLRLRNRLARLDCHIVDPTRGNVPFMVDKNCQLDPK